MNIVDFKKSMDYMFKAQVTPFVWGHAGVGKSTAVKQYAESKGYKFFPFYLGTMSDTGDVLGLAEFVKKSENRKATHFAPPDWLFDMIEYCESNPESGAVVFLDEFNRARRDILNGMFSFALDKTFHTIKLPKNCYVIAAGNPPTDEYCVTDVDDTALMSRFVHIKLEPTFNEWTAYAKQNGMDHNVLGFFQEQPELISDKKSTFQLPVKMDHRSVDRWSALIKAGTPQDLLDQLLHGIIGSERLVAFKLYLQNSDKPLSAEDVLTGKNLDKVVKWSNPIDVKSSLVSITCDNVFDKLSTETTISTKYGDNLLNFLETIPKESAYTLLMKLYRKDTKWFDGYTRDARYEKKLIKLIREGKGKAA